MITVARLLAECQNLRPAGPDPALDALRRAILVEDTLGITLTDAQFDVDFLTDGAALTDFVRRQRPPD